MSRDKQIEEMAKVICAPTANKGNCEKCGFKKHCSKFDDATDLYNAGYRKSQDVVEEIFAEIERYLRLNEDIAIKCKEENGEQNREYFKGKLAAYLQIRGFVDVELKRQYKEGRK